VHGDLDRADAVGDRVVDLDDHAGATLGQPVHDDQLPQRTSTVEPLHRHGLGRVEEVAQ
jgi:hypothetical protein